jgi:hypothetical protein
MKIKVDVRGIEATKAYLAGMGKQVNFATAVALTRTAKQVEQKIQRDIPVKFDRPKPQTTKGTFVKKATKSNLEAVVGINDRVSAYLAPNIGSSGQVWRDRKRSEQMLSAAGILPEGHYTVPGAGARLDAYGNMSRGQIVQILSYFRTFGNTALNTKRLNATDKYRARIAKQRSDYFVVPVASRELGLFPGIWQRTGVNSIKPVLLFVGRPLYSAIYNLSEEAKREAQRVFDIEFKLALDNALATAR